jgi:DNA-directed RNA polymerase specialized sigma24 family protein
VVGSMTKEQLVATVELCRAGDRQAASDLVKQFDRMAKGFAAKYSRKWNWDIVYNDCLLAVLRAVNTWDPSKGSFTTCVYNWMRGEAFNAIARSKNTVGLTGINDKFSVYDSRNKAGESIDKIANELGVSEQFVQRRIMAFRVSPIVEERDEPSFNPVMDTALLMRQVMREVDALPPKDREVLLAREMREESFDEIGRRLGCSRQRVHQLYKRSLLRVREQIMEPKIKDDRHFRQNCKNMQEIKPWIRCLPARNDGEAGVMVCACGSESSITVRREKGPDGKIHPIVELQNEWYAEHSSIDHARECGRRIIESKKSEEQAKKRVKRVKRDKKA